MGGDNPQLDFALDVLRKMDPDRVEPELLERAFDTDILGLDGESLGFQGVGDLVGIDRAVQMPLGIGVCFDREQRCAI